MRLDRFLTLYFFRPLRALGVGSSRARTLPVLMYHSISDDPEPEFSSYYKVCTAPKRFAEHMQWLADDGYRGVTLTEGLEWLNASVPAPSSEASIPPSGPRSPLTAHSSALSQQRIAITFDDGFRDFHTEAFPILRRHGFTATMYLPTAFIGDERQSFKGRECLTWAEVLKLQMAGMEFGSHTVNHPKLVDLPWSEIERELRDSKATIEDRLQRPCPAFAYPFAFPQARLGFRDRFLEILRATGYESCATTEIGAVRPGDEPLQTKRFPVNSCDDKALFRAKLMGAYNWIGAPQKAVKHLKSMRSLQTRPAP